MSGVKTHYLRVSVNRSFLPGTLVKIEAEFISFDWTNDNDREAWLDLEGAVGNAVNADGVWIEFDEPYRIEE